MSLVLHAASCAGVPVHPPTSRRWTTWAASSGTSATTEVPAPDTEQPMVSRSVRLPLDTYERVRAAAEARGIGVTTLMRQWIEAGLADLDESATVSLADVRRALAALAHPTAA
ncbi:MAG TPA: hypothetical protein VF462_17270 [Micromonosporaceae bacterium]